MTILRSLSTSTAAAVLAVAATAAMSTGDAAAKAKLKKVTVGLHSATHRPVVPTVHVKFQAAKWRLVRRQITFDLSVYARANVGSNVHHLYVTAPSYGVTAANRWQAGYRGGSLHLTIRADHTKHAMPQSSLGKFGQFAVEFCTQQIPSGVGKFTKDFTLPVEIGVALFYLGKTKLLTATRSIKIRIFCDGRPPPPPPPRAGNAPKPLRVTFARVKLIKVGQHCPRKVIASVLIQTNTPGKVPYVLRSKRGYRWTRELSVQFRNPQGIHQASRDHIFHVKKSTQDEFWLEIKGRRRSPIRKPLKVVCVKGGPKGLTK